MTLIGSIFLLKLFLMLEYQRDVEGYKTPRHEINSSSGLFFTKAGLCLK
jgi:hypothetical protein